MTDLRIAGIGMTSARTRDRLVQRLRDQGIVNPAVLERIRNVPRHIFVDEALGSRAYEDTALPIGFGQTISQPYIVARMTEALLDGGPLARVLEIGTGCGYQSAVLSPLVTTLFTIERIAPLMERARERLKELGMRNVRFRHGDGSVGWKAHGPFDGILVAAAPLSVPAAWDLRVSSSSCASRRKTSGSRSRTWAPWRSCRFWAAPDDFLSRYYMS